MEEYVTSLVINVPGEYISLGLVLQSALEQASRGKGKERHASAGEAYENQIICEVTRRLGSGYPLGQAVKKIYEAQRLGGEKGRAELLGAINYIAAAAIVMQKVQEEGRGEEDDGPRIESHWPDFVEKKKAEGCEELVQDAPRTREELLDRIVDCNPSVFKPRTPTGEELAEMAEENAHG